MENIVLVSHGDMAEGIKSSYEMIVGKQEHVFTVSLKDTEQFENDLKSIMSGLTGSTLIIADILGGTPSNISVKNYLNDPDVSIISGMSLPLTIEAILNKNIDINELINIAKSGVGDVKAMIKATNDNEDE